METMVKQSILLQTPVLQEMVSKAVKACSYLEAFPITGYLKLVAKEGKLTITSTDNINILKLEKSGVDGEIDIVVSAKLFSALVSKMSSPNIEISIEGSTVIVKGNGRYEVPLIQEEDGSSVDMPSYNFDTNVSSNQINNVDIRNILTMNKSCKADMKEVPALFNYYMDQERVLTTNYFKACNNPVKLFNSPVCLPPEIVELIPVVADDSGVTVQQNEDSVLFTSTNGTLYGKKSVAEDLEQYPVQDLLNCMNEQYAYSCIINKTLLINALERLCLFTGDYDSNAVNLTFDKDKVTLTTKRCNTNESISYLQAPVMEGSFKITLDAIFLKNQLISSPKEDATLKFGSEEGIQIVCDKIVQLSGCLGEE
jgi:DNA polymerase III sliding clamp (beta) subunit (PCNA family)